MKRSKIPGIIAAMAILAACFTVQLLADDAAIISVLTSGTWKISGKGWWVSRVFYTDGTFASTSSKGKPLAGGNWRIESNDVFLNFTDGHTETVALPLDPAGTVGSGGTMHFTYVLQGSGGKNNAPAATPDTSLPPSTPISPEMQQKAADLVKTYHNSLVFVTGKEGSGSGFIATLGKSNLLFSNAHVAAGIRNASFKTLDDTAVQAGAAAVAVGRDIFCMAQPAGGVPLQIMDDVGSNASIGDDVVVLGNAEGEGVINTITGQIVGIGADRVEINAPFVPGNSGSPIIHLKSGKVIGIATYLVINNYDAATSEKNAKPTVRRFGYRLDNVKGWQAVDWRAFYAQATEMENIETLTADLFDLFSDLQENHGRITAGRHTNPVIKTRLDQWMADITTNRSAEDMNMANANFFSFLKVSCQADVTAAKRHMSYDYFQHELAEQQEARDAMTKAFEQIVNNIRD